MKKSIEHSFADMITPDDVIEQDIAEIEQLMLLIYNHTLPTGPINLAQRLVST